MASLSTVLGFYQVSLIQPSWSILTMSNMFSGLLESFTMPCVCVCVPVWLLSLLAHLRVVLHP